MDKIKKLTFGVVSSAIAFSLLAAPALAATIEISGNGNNSSNTANVSSTSSVAIVQENSSDFTNRIKQSGHTGENQANSNTGGSVDIDTGDVSNTANVTNTGGGNTALVEKAPPDLPDVDIKNNGNNSTNKAKVKLTDTTVGAQSNSCTTKNRVKQRGKTGKNKANNNTGSGVTTDTGKVTNTETIGNTCADNSWTVEP